MFFFNDTSFIGMLIYHVYVCDMSYRLAHNVPHLSILHITAIIRFETDKLRLTFVSLLLKLRDNN